ncbi:hypothetical protein ACHAAC_15650 [Aeromicrobium sp. CF4.19]|uniref:hypothetical protein n=1 Tax=Aeromicrobium sp. CF4.19 TaxID=3373082 RepID=UPI003EE51CA7
MPRILPQFARWTPAALEVLRETASRYGAVITTYQLADEVTARTGVPSPTERRTWIGDLVEMTALAAERAGDPPLTSLCVQRDGTVGEAYVRVVAATTGDIVRDVEQRAAEDRLACYRALAENMPADGGTPRPARPRSPSRPGSTSRPAGTRKAAATSSRATNAAAVKPVAVCPTCFTALPATGQCDYCD